MKSAYVGVVAALLIVSCAVATAQDRGRTNKTKPAGYIPFKDFEALPMLKGVVRTTDDIGDAMWIYDYDSTAAAYTNEAFQQIYTKDTLRIVFEAPTQDELHWSFCGTPNDANLEPLVGEFINPNGPSDEARYEVCISRALLYYLAQYDSTFEYRLIRRAYQPKGMSKLNDDASYNGRSSEELFRTKDYLESDPTERRLFKWTQPYELVLTNFQVQSLARLATYLRSKLNDLIINTELDKKVKFPVSIGIYPMVSYDGRPSYLDVGSKAYFRTKTGIDSGVVEELASRYNNYGRSDPTYVTIVKPAPSKYDQPVRISYYLLSCMPSPTAEAKVAGLYFAFKAAAPPSFIDALGDAMVKLAEGNQEHAKTVTNSAKGTLVNFRIGSITKSISISGVVESASPGKFVEIKVVSVTPSTASNGKPWQYNGKNIQNNEKIIVLSQDISSP